MHRRRRRGLALVGLVLVVAAAHLWLTQQLVSASAGWGAAPRPPARIEVAFVRELQQQAPPATLRRLPPPPPRPPRAALPALPVASAPLPPPVPEALPPVQAELAPAPEPIAAAALPASAPAPAFEWPPSTQLSYTVTGYFRGPVEGQAQVQWLRQGERYQVHLDVSIGPAFAPLVTRRMSSEGELGSRGLRPRRYDEETRAVLMAPRQLTLWFDDDQVRLPSGAAVARPEGVQDAASQFVQMTWMFTLDPTRLTPGRTVEMPLALPRRVDTWIYDVLEPELLDTPAGAVPAVRIKPRREARPGGDLTAELWVAPTLMYLPVRIVIRQDTETYADMLIRRLPQQAVAEPPTTR